jgi:hypothetical protein
MSDIKLFKLVTGEEVLCTVIDTNDTSYVIENSVVLIYQQRQDGKMSAGFAPFMPYAKEYISISISAIIAETSVDDEMIFEYKRIFSGITIAPASVIIS